jgi:hypothetical protein
VAQAVPEPQRQSPVEEQLSARSSQATQVDPAEPQAASERVAQVTPSQQPLGQDAPSQIHSPRAQRCPPAQGGPAPHAQLPLGLQRSAPDGSQAAQDAPAVPQVVTVAGLQRLPRQQPAGQEAPSQRQAPFMQRWPAAQGGPLPHRHAPETAQLSAFPGSQLAQAAAATPHVSTERG